MNACNIFKVPLNNSCTAAVANTWSQLDAVVVNGPKILHHHYVPATVHKVYGPYYVATAKEEPFPNLSRQIHSCKPVCDEKD